MTNLALNPFKKGKKTEVEGVRKVDVENDPLLEEVIDQYNSIEDNIPATNVLLTLKKLKPIYLTPEKINLFTKYVISGNLYKTVKEHPWRSITGQYISKLIQDSYTAGNNYFVLNTYESAIQKLGSYLRSESDRRLRLTINGNVGNSFARAAYFINVEINGNVGNDSFFRSVGSVFTLNGRVGHNSGDCARDCYFKTNNEKTYDVWKNDMNENNTIFLLGEDKEVIKWEKK